MKKFFLTAITLAVFAGFNASASDFEPGIQDITETEALELADLGLDVGINIGRVYECRARNLRGLVFTAQAPNKSRAQNLSVRKCYNAGSRQCNLVGCKSKWSIGFGSDRDDRWGGGRDRDDRWDGGRDRDDRRGPGGRGRR